MTYNRCLYPVQQGGVAVGVQYAHPEYVYSKAVVRMSTVTLFQSKDQCAPLARPNSACIVSEFNL